MRPIVIFVLTSGTAIQAERREPRIFLVGSGGGGDPLSFVQFIFNFKNYVIKIMLYV